jgi:glutamyl-tRNA synthetase
MYDRRCRTLAREEAEKRVAAGESHVVRLAVPTEGSIVVEDLIHGRIEFPWAQVDDQVIVKSDGMATYHLAAMADDHDMEISHVIRGEEWISSVPKHWFIYQSLGWTLPQFAHVPLVLNADRSKMCKRQGDVAAEDYLKKGYLPEALINFLALLGWNPTADREIFSKEELASLFDIEKVNKSGAVFNIEKLNWLNQHYIKELSEDVYLAKCAEFLGRVMTEEESRAALVARERIVRFDEIELATQEIIEHFTSEPVLLVWKKQTKEDTLARLTDLRAWLGDRADAWFSDVAGMEADLRVLITERGWGNGDTLWPLRVALSGREKSPSPFALLFVLGKEESLRRIDEAVTSLA